LFNFDLQEMMMPCAETVDTLYLTDMLVQVLNSEQELLSLRRAKNTPTRSFVSRTVNRK
jgi:hypothetical protein